MSEASHFPRLVFILVKEELMFARGVQTPCWNTWLLPLFNFMWGFSRRGRDLMRALSNAGPAAYAAGFPHGGRVTWQIYGITLQQYAFFANDNDSSWLCFTHNRGITPTVLSGSAGFCHRVPLQRYPKALSLSYEMYSRDSPTPPNYDICNDWKMSSNLLVHGGVVFEWADTEGGVKEGHLCRPSEC